MSGRDAYFRLGGIIFIYLALAVSTTILLPFHKAPDEIAHFEYARFVAEAGRLPTNYDEREQAGFKSDWPGLYHMLAAGLMQWSDSHGPPYLKFVKDSPRFDLAQDLLDTKRLANTEDELWPYRGPVLMWYLGRLATILVGVGIILVTFLTTRELFPDDYFLAVVSAAFIAFIPTFIFITSAMSDDPLVGLLIGWYTLVFIRIIKNPERGLWPYIWLGLILGISVTAKYTSVILPVQIFVVLAYLARQHGWGLRTWLGRVTVVGGASMLAASWWFAWIIIYFNEIETFGLLIGLLNPLFATGIDPSQNFIAARLSGGQIGLASSPEFVPEPFWWWSVEMFRSFWVTKIGAYPLSPAAHSLIGLVCLAAVVSWLNLWQRRPKMRIWLYFLIFHAGLFFVFPIIRFFIMGHVDITAQGRHLLFAFASILPLLFVISWPSHLRKRTQRVWAILLIGGLLSWSLAQTIRVATFYPPRLPIRTTANVEISRPLDEMFGPHLNLVGYDLNVRPEDSTLHLALYWQSSSYPDEDYRMTVRLVREGQVHLQWTAYPINGRYPTRIWEAEETIRDDLSFPLVDLAPGAYEIQLQLFDSRGLLWVGDDRDHFMVAQVTVPTSTPLPPALNFRLTVDGRQVVRGVSLWQAEAWRALDLPIYRPRMAIPFVWTEGQRQANERVQWLLVDPHGDVYPATLASPHFQYFLIGLDWPSGRYRLRAEVWRDETVLASQETPVLVEIFNERPRQLEPSPIATPLEVNFADQIKLLGYDLPVRHLEAGQGVPVTLQWQGLRTTAQSYTIFTKLFDEEQRLWASVERLPADGYSTIHWLENEVVTDSFELPVTDESIPPGVYWLNLGIYEEVDRAAVSLPVLVDGQPGQQTSVFFGTVKIGGPPPGVVLEQEQIKPAVPLSLEFGDPPHLVLRGYDLAEVGHNLQVTLYWHSLTETTLDWNAFVHLRGKSNEIIAQQDGPLGSGRYPTSLWQPGEIIADTFHISTEDVSNDEMDLVVGLYQVTTGQRLPLYNADATEALLTELR